MVTRSVVKAGRLSRRLESQLNTGSSTVATVLLAKPEPRAQLRISRFARWLGRLALG